ncbi:hypothetical protein IAR50_007255 [Cryptococcus sp. DSM 104548]
MVHCLSSVSRVFSKRGPPAGIVSGEHHCIICREFTKLISTQDAKISSSQAITTTITPATITTAAPITPAAPTVTTTPITIATPMIPNSSDGAFRILQEVESIIFQHLANIEPVTALLISKAYYNTIKARVYREMKFGTAMLDGHLRAKRGGSTIGHPSSSPSLSSTPASFTSTILKVSRDMSVCAGPHGFSPTGPCCPP